MPENKSSRPGNIFDKILKENIEAIFLPLFEKFFGIKIKDSHPLDAKMQATIERENDFLRLVSTEQDEEFIIHIEFQTTNESGMIFRIKEYNGMIQRKYKLEVKHYLIYLGAGKMTMQTRLEPKFIFSGFDVMDFNMINYNTFMQSQVPQEIIMAILTDFKGKDPEKIINLIINKLLRVCKNQSDLKKFIAQLRILSNLRKLEDLTVEKIKSMPITYDFREDLMYKQGREEGREEERKKEQEKRLATQKSQIRKMHSDGLSVEQIADYLLLRVAFVKKIVEEIEAEEDDV